MKQTSKNKVKNTPEYSLHFFPLTSIYFSYELMVYFVLFIMAYIKKL